MCDPIDDEVFLSFYGVYTRIKVMNAVRKHLSIIGIVRLTRAKKCGLACITQPVMYVGTTGKSKLAESTPDGTVI